MKISKIEFENFRNFKDHGEIRCSTDGKVTIIYGRNGDGKTTLHQLFQWVFYGKVHFNKTTTDRLYNHQYESEAALGEEFPVLGCIDFEHEGKKYSARRMYTYKKGLQESEEMADELDEKAAKYGLQDQIEVSFNAQYVMITLNGSVLFDSGSEVIKQEALPLVDKVGRILDHYSDNIIEVEGHTDNVPIHNGRFADNNVLSMYRALSVADYLREVTSLNPAHIKSSGRGDYVPIADNATAEGRALNRRVVIKIYNSYNSEKE